MSLPRFIKSTGFRFALLHTFLFVVSVAVIGWAAEVTVTAALQRHARERVEIEAASLVTEYQQHGLSGLRAAIEQRAATRKRRLRYAIVDAQNRTIMGDDYLAAFAGPSTAGAQVRRRDDGEDATDAILVATRDLAVGTRVIVADNLESIEDVEDVVENAFLIALALAIVLGLGAGALFTRSLLRRVDAVTRTAEAIISGDLSQRIAVTGSGDDFDRLSSTLNAMLDRIAGLLENLHQVSNDIAHDLRTPLSRLRQRLEHAKTHAASTSEYEHAVDRAIKEADEILETFSALLRIAQIEAGTRRASFRRVDLSEAVHNVAEAYAPAAEDAGRLLQTEIAPGVTITGDRELLVQLFANLIENALHHTPQAAPILIRLRAEHGQAVAEVCDKGPGIPAEERGRVLRRFYRLERSRTTHGSGLGLSLVQAIAQLHNADLALTDNEPGLRVVLRFALTPD